jgi:hypothetical protein
MIEAVRVAKDGGPLTKRIWLDADRNVRSDGSACVMTTGRARRWRISDISDFAGEIAEFRSNEALTLGALKSSLPDTVEVTTRRRLNQAPRPDQITRTLDYFEFRPGVAALALLDFDTKGMPAEIAAKLTAADGFWPAICAVIPELGGAARVHRASTSAGLYRADTRESIAGSIGCHVFVLVEDGSDINRFLTDMHQRCWLAGLGWIMVGAGGQLLERSIVDRMVGSPERLVFEGPPVLDRAVAQDQSIRVPDATEGQALDTVAACPPLTRLEKAQLCELHAKEANRLAPEAARARKAFVVAQAQQLRERTGMAPHRAAQIIERQCAGVLLPDVTLPFDDDELAGATVGDVLADPDRFDDATLADPIEGVIYGPGKAKVMRRVDGTPWINSFAHGGTVYELRLDYCSAEAAVNKATPDQAVDVFVQCVLAGDLGEDDIERLRNLTSRVSCVGIRSLDARLKRARGERRRLLESVKGTPRVIAELNETFAVIRVANKVAILNEHSDPEGRPTFSLLPPDGFKLLLANRNIEIDAKRLPLADHWIQHPRRREHEGITFAPQGTPPGYYNLWRGFAVGASQSGSCDLFKRHLLENVCDGSQNLFAWVFGWFADIFQHPSVKCGTSLVLRGGMGVGKSIVGDTFGHLLGLHYVQTADPRYVTGRFNAHLVRCALFHCDEAFWAGDHAAEGKLKDLVTGKRHPIELKGYEVFFVPNYIRLFINGNPGWLVPAGMDERRFATLDVGEAHKQDIPYFRAIVDELERGGYPRLLHELLTFDLTRVDLRTIPKTDALLDQKIASLSPERAWWLDVLKGGQLPECNGDSPYKCPGKALFEHYTRHAQMTGVRRRQIETAIGIFLKNVVPKGMLRSKVECFTRRDSLGAEFEDRGTVYAFPPLEVCRQTFAEMLQQPIEWGELTCWEAPTQRPESSGSRGPPF